MGWIYEPNLNIGKVKRTTWGRSQQVSSDAQVVLQMISKDCSANCEDRCKVVQVVSLILWARMNFKWAERNNDITGADPLLGPLVFTNFPSISKPSVGKFPSGRADLSLTCWQSTERDTLTWLTDRWTCHMESREATKVEMKQFYR